MLHIYHFANELGVRIGLFGAAPFFRACPAILTARQVRLNWIDERPAFCVARTKPNDLFDAESSKKRHRGFCLLPDLGEVHGQCPLSAGTRHFSVESGRWGFGCFRQTPEACL